LRENLKFLKRTDDSFNKILSAFTRGIKLKRKSITKEERQQHIVAEQKRLEK
jgi:predicted secreted protein